MIGWRRASCCGVPPGGTAPERKGPLPRGALTAEQISQAEAMVITQDRAAIVLNKPPGLATQGGTGMREHVDGLLDAFLPFDDARTGSRPRLVHRLDKETSGVLLIARTAGSAAFFSKRFSGRSARKIYWALVTGVPAIEDGFIDLPLAKQPGTGGEKMMVDESGEGADRPHPLPGDRPCRQPRRLGRAATADRADPSAARPHGGNRPSDCRRPPQKRRCPCL